MVEYYGNTDNPTVMVVGVFHGDEPQGYHLITEYYKKNSATKLLLIPCLNKSGFNAGTRVNANGVDLNRNYPTKNWALTEKNEFYGGCSPASEVETRFLIDIIEKYMPKIILTLHAPFKVVNFDGVENSQSEYDVRKIAKRISDIINYPIQENIGYPTPGSFGTWAGIEKGISTITLELDEEVSVKELEGDVFKIFKMLEEY